MAIATSSELLEAIRSTGLLSAKRIGEAKALAAKLADPKEFAKELVRRGWLTAWQAKVLAQGRGTELLLGGYVLMQPLGEGGMGQVYQARQQRLQRLAAIKVIRKDRLVSPAATERFRREAQAAARLAHRNIIAVFDAGEAQGIHFLAMEYVEGTDLAKLVRNQGRLAIGVACDCIRQAALGLQHAHEQGLVHRDIKPSNLMRTTEGVIKILDMGLARLNPAVGGAGMADLTATGQVIGTPDYISPEQAMNAKQVDIRADIYSLGCSLYYLLTARPPFAGESMTEKLLKHHLEEPPAIEGLRAGLPPGLAAIVRRMMSKKPEERFQTPGDVATALEAFADLKESLSPTAAYIALDDDETVAGDRPHTPGPAAGRARSRWGVPIAVGLVAALLVGGWFLLWPGSSPVSKSSTPIASATSPTAAETRPDWSKAPLAKLCSRKPTNSALTSVAFADDGQRLAAGSSDATCRVRASDDCRGIANLTGHSDAIYGVVYAAGDKRIATASKDGTVKLWNGGTAKELLTCTGHTGAVWCVAFSPISQRLASGGQDSSIKVWNPDTGQVVQTLTGHTEAVHGLAFSPDGQRLASASYDNTARVWDLPSGTATLLFKSGSDLTCVAWSPDGQRIATAGRDWTLRVWDAASGKLLFTGKGHGGGIYCLAFAANSRLLASGSSDHTIKLWDVSAATELISWPAHEMTVTGLAFRPDGKCLASVGDDKMLTLWDTSGFSK